ncbi:MAG: hypothetical protein ACXAC6_07800 [Candidatus Hodarchaeales archaeon]|jgi:hypothetical protein
MTNLLQDPSVLIYDNLLLRSNIRNYNLNVYEESDLVVDVLFFQNVNEIIKR